MTKTVLILFIFGHAGMSGHSGLTSAEFDTPAACAAAVVAAKREWGGNVSGICTPK